MARPKNQSIMDVVRMLNLLPYFQKHPGRSMMEAAVDLGLDSGTIMADLNRLFCCGIGDMPDELVDLDPQRQAVRIYDAQGMDKPLRLTRTEAGALLLALESLESIPGLVEKQAVTSAATKLRGIMRNETSGVFDSVAVADSPEQSQVAVLCTALENGNQVTFEYYHRGRDDVTSRTVSPVRLFSKEGRTYLNAYDHGVQEHRVFRVDMIRAVNVLDASAEPHLSTLQFSADDPFRLANATDKARLRIAPQAAWLVDTLPCEIEEVAADGTISVVLSLGSRDWLVQFVLNNADRVSVVEPAAIAHAVRDRAKVGLTAYHQS